MISGLCPDPKVLNMPMKEPEEYITSWNMTLKQLKEE